MLIEITFLVTTTLLIMLLIKMIGAICGNDLNLPTFIPYMEITPARNFVMYPSIMFQVWYWAETLGVFPI